jgi:uncharacterized protein
MESYELNRGRVGTLETSRAEAAANDFLWKVYRWMSVGLGLTAVLAMLVASSPALTSALFGNPMLFYGLLIGELVMVVAFSARAARMSATTAATMFLAYSALNGVTLASLFLIYTAASISQVFFITAGSFAALSFFGATTKRNLSALGRFLFFALFGLIIASVVNIFFKNPALYWLTSYAGVLIFAGLTAHDNQKLKAMFLQQGESGNLALQGALILYLDFVNLFLMLLRIFGKRR